MRTRFWYGHLDNTKSNNTLQKWITDAFSWNLSYVQTDATTPKKFDLSQNFAQELVPITRTNVQQSVQTDETM